MGVIFKNNVMYGAGDIEISPVCYSEEEREVGCWIDGKPLYECTFVSTTAVNGTTPVVVANTGANTEIKKFTGIINNSRDINSRLDTANYSYSWIATSKYQVGNYALGDVYASLPCVVVCQYTKTTDTPGSGIWTPSGVPAVHYSTDEQVVGTWADGSTIYEKTFEFSSQLVLTPSNWTNSSATVTGISNILDIIGYDNATVFRLLGARPSNDTIQLFATITVGISKITIRYTKTTS